jgi:hypothetical protein
VVRLDAKVFVARSAADVWAYLGEVSNVAQWDRGVAATETTSATAPGMGFEFDTLALRNGKPAVNGWGKMSYRITEIDPVNGCTVQLTSKSGNARYFKSAAWRFRVEDESGGSKVFCAAEFTLRWRYLFLAPVFYRMKIAIRSDLERLKRVLETPGE